MSQPDIIETEVTRPYWQALREGRLAFQECDACGHKWLPARSNCPTCLSDKTHWRPASGQGRLVSWVIYHKAYAPHLADKVPYNVAIIELAEGPRLLSNIVDLADHGELRVNAPVKFKIGESLGRAVPHFTIDTV